VKLPIASCDVTEMTDEEATKYLEYHDFCFCNEGYP
jgi:hypothetical protein